MTISPLDRLRNRKIALSEFRRASNQLSQELAEECQKQVAAGAAHNVIVPILRAGLALLPAFLEVYEDASVGFIGLKRDEHSFEPHEYYRNLPVINNNSLIIVLDPMLATGGSACEAIKILKEAGAGEDQILLVSCIAAPEGYARVHLQYPKVRIQIRALDKGLNKKKFIVPGLGDYGDRFFGTDF